jgi:hypothetical protein
MPRYIHDASFQKTLRWHLAELEAFYSREGRRADRYAISEMMLDLDLGRVKLRPIRLKSADGATPRPVEAL